MNIINKEYFDRRYGELSDAVRARQGGVEIEHQARISASRISGEVKDSGFTSVILQKCLAEVETCPEFGEMLLLSLWNELTKGTELNPYRILSPRVKRE
ncbi:MAG: hypothetical protein A2312_04755 [Candidatus Staskawiczbacteria bacterium RIFOXYB2_FULL_32_9]|uniref:Uncharacterized protein n=1 Tax=Candidatus Staskawiczbacteria bacterium RIFOXYD1_FULL_32_13 TaxID=1802234 RepID=A0A1G2JQ99_9BACT|nr:MAG: hypothetical protein UR22_C0012G0043 [Parcubacteria group bacterium GW2011_GWC2_32_10]OGZ79249.1 MAG: hypothetical protein A2360_02850 [Candidatus Staskawiczbacteria bacterium RIFOXYB1_FULL_32_11]OGZ79260.1 MAG: hypothetical protein A2256_01185 [Candidatus Staskawiczbacteria bacterium RIFOXYA2_FULL_32_7]OGZ81243.1 MAG: hypothetical protein A2312_04755 [Candidatus Staskawiczbacteria bacterium RIFOXYB2_FULL_32_9]OGZ85034.1 MAG: hypothetical protein A2463_04625 [Candidatus Staskawiczbacter